MFRLCTGPARPFNGRLSPGPDEKRQQQSGETRAA
jgi:hypothetical protein